MQVQFTIPKLMINDERMCLRYITVMPEAFQIFIYLGNLLTAKFFNENIPSLPSFGF